jgi:Uma2 family endonuclease
MAALYPEQGYWGEAEYLALETNRRIEFCDGFLEFPAMPTISHQRIVKYLCALLSAFVDQARLGEVLFAGTRVRLRPGKVREPDVVFRSAKRSGESSDLYWEGADLVMEVVSIAPEDRKRDLVDKRAEYAEAGVPEYWIVDPKSRTITVLKLKGKKYAVHGRFGRGWKATSALLPGFAVDVKAVFERKQGRAVEIG